MAATAERTTPPVTPAGDRSRPPQGVVCHLIASNFAGGPEKQIIEQSVLLGARGWGVVVGSFRENRATVEVIENARARGLETFLIATRSPFSPGAIGQLVGHLSRRRVDVLVSHGYKSDLLGHLAARRAGIVQLPMLRGYTAENRKVRLYEAIDRRLLRRFRTLICVSAALRDALVRQGFDARRIEVLHNAVTSDAEVVAIDPRAEFGWPPETRIVVAAGRLSPEKGQRYLIDALRLLNGRRPPVAALILGAGREEPELRRRIAEGGLAGRCVLAGFRRPIPGYLAGADLLVNPSLSEGLPNVVLEALAVKTPVVATDVGGVAELIVPGETGWLVPPADPAALAQAIAAALDDREQARAQSENGRRLVASAFSFSRQAERFAEICARALRASRARAGSPSEERNS